MQLSVQPPCSLCLCGCGQSTPQERPHHGDTEIGTMSSLASSDEMHDLYAVFLMEPGGRPVSATYNFAVQFDRDPERRKIQLFY
jgi:hypothetical protein